MKFGEVYERLWKPFWNKDNKQSASAIFFEISNAIPKEIWLASHLFYLFFERNEFLGVP